MMLHPSYSDLMEVANEGVDEGEEKLVNSRYSIVLAAAKRARQLIDGAPAYVPTDEKSKPLSTAVEELYEGKVKIIGGEDGDDKVVTESVE
jgi:DNA-directed RNA polymerase subunit omega